MFTEPKVLLARMRCLPFHRKLSRMATAVGHLVWIDFHGTLVRSRIQQFIGHFSIIDDFSRLGFMFFPFTIPRLRLPSNVCSSFELY